MENRKSLVVALILFFPFIGFAYDGETTHPALTQEAIKLFQASYPDVNFIGEEIQLIEKGSSLEDEPNSRCLNHFYDPIHNKALHLNETSKSWAKNTLSQASVMIAGQDYFSSNTDYSWDRAIFEYAHGDKKRGLETLGHVIHLIQDKAVPDHTRLDSHALGSPYESWAKRHTKANINIASGLIKEKEMPIIYSVLDRYFDGMASYSNLNFFSLDTILDKGYLKPEIKKEEVFVLKNGVKTLFGVGISQDGIPYKLVQINKFRNLDNDTIEINYTFDDMDHLVLSDYWPLLSNQAVLHSAGVIKLFFDEVEKEKRTFALADKNKIFAQHTDNSVRDLVHNQLAMLGIGLDTEDVVAPTPLPTPNIIVPSVPVLSATDQAKITDLMSQAQALKAMVEALQQTLGDYPPVGGLCPAMP